MSDPDTARIVFIAACVPILVACTGHGIATLIDVVKPTFFTPTIPEVRGEMERTGIRLRTTIARGGDPGRPTLWRAWLGFNLSHSLGGVAVMALFLALAVTDFAFVTRVGFILPGALVTAACYFILALRFWFFAPAIATGLATVGYAVAWLIA